MSNLVFYLSDSDAYSDINSGIRAEGLKGYMGGEGVEGSCRNDHGVRVEGGTSGEDEDGDIIFAGVERTKGVRGINIGQGYSGYNDLGRIAAKKLVRKGSKIKIRSRKASPRNLKSMEKKKAMSKEERNKKMQCFHCQQLDHISIYCPSDGGYIKSCTGKRWELIAIKIGFDWCVADELRLIYVGYLDLLE
ncbi:hypothetical protein L1987_19584 [Smallanthus sonchifolius]|uniref:Uncharacterized protein n=1 Tax=Smallanthus sonchifolius TaxID=185202 RepID=A0ACB9IP06_9ASTR|nr:hypothetical protein L1987_19584 [Smallanthus sonchifolius]